jgi:heme A synthase
MEPALMIRTVARTRALPILAWFYVVALGVQVFFAGMYVFVGASNIELHRNMAHVLGITTLLLLVAAFVGRSPHRRLALGVLGLLILQGMLVHVGQWFGLWTIAALHPVNALVLTYAAYTLARRASEAWNEERAGLAATPSSLDAQSAAA